MAGPFWQAAPLCERRVPHHAVRETGRLQAARERHERWQRAVAGESAEGLDLWRRRLAAAALDDTTLLAILADQDVPEPEWAADLAAAFADPESTSIDRADGSPFVALSEPIAGRSHRRFVTAVEPVAEDRLPAPDRLAELLLSGLLPRLSGIAQRTCLLELAADRAKGVLAGDTPQERFTSFLQRLREPGRRWDLLARYPVLARQLEVTSRAWVDQAVEFVQRLAADMSPLIETFSPRADPGPVIDVTTGLGDPHRGARSVAMVHFASGLRIVYKPRPSAIDSHFQDLLTWVNDRTLGPAYLVLRCLDRGDHGWMEYVEAAPPPDHEATQRFYWRQGGLLALLYLVHAGDFHAENLIAAGDQPVLVDLETLFQPTLPSLRSPDDSSAERLAADMTSGSVLHAGLLPIGPSPWGVEISGMRDLGGPQTHSPVVRVPQVADARTDQMRVGLALPADDQAPAPDGERPIRLSDHVDDIVGGFTETYRVLLENRDDLAAPDGPLAAFAQDDVRVLVRDTMTYAMLLEASFHPTLLTDGLDRERHFDRLWRDAIQRPGIGAFIEAERRDLWRGDIPIFTIGVAGGPLRDSHREEVSGVRVTPGMDITQEILGRLGEDDLARQTWLVRACIAINAVRRERRLLFHRHRTEPADQPATDVRIVDAAAAVADRLSALAIRDDGGAVWIGAQTGSHRDWSVGVLGPNLYDGLLGIALFLAYHAELSDDRGCRALAGDAARIGIRQVRRGRLARTVGFTGLGGAVYALSHLGALWSDAGLLDEAARIADDLGDLIAEDRQYEVMDGTAGAAFGLAALYRARPSGRVLDLIRAAADHLLTSQRPWGAAASWLPADAAATGVTTRPLAGFGHGTAGISAALLTMAGLLGDDRCVEAAEQGFDYERELFDHAGGHWRDVRHLPQAGEVEVEFDGALARLDRPVAWCHGSPGIGLSRLRASSRLDVSVDLQAAVADTMHEGFGNGHSLCHGDTGSLDFLQLAATQGNDPALHEQVRRRAATMLDSIDHGGWHCGLHRDIEVPGLLTGLAGIGYGLLRLVAPERVPSVLAQEPPPS